MRAIAVVVRGMRMLALLLGVAVLAGAAPAEGQAARVLGRVTDGVGNPVAEARVTLVAQGAGAATHETVSGPTGGFQFAGVAPGVYTLRATRDGVGVQERRVTVRAGQVVSQIVRLLPGRAALQVVSAVRSSGL
ncbi:MAG TPA: carboxypeptidase-like regulatory domain-containing protein [Longimicrobium sp.]|nr:carboxypeptidase-like regulatory domain-containing protein [Longimicrobium sp.]